MTLEEITREWNETATKMQFPTIGITDCKNIETIYDEEIEASYECCSFGHYYDSKSENIKYDLGFDDYGDHGYWNLYDRESNDLIKCDECPQAIMDYIHR